MKKRVYSEKEVAELLRRTAELQQRTARPNNSGLTLDELESVAVEAGLDPKMLRMAAQEMHLPKTGQLLLSADTTKTHNLVDRWIEGAISQEQWDDVVASLRFRFDTDLGRAMGMPHYGTSEENSKGRNFEWKHTSMSGVETRIILQPGDGGYRMQMSQRVGWASNTTEGIAYGSLVGVFIGFILLAATDASMFGILATALCFIASIGMAYAIDRSWRKRKHAELYELADSVVSMLEANAHLSGASSDDQFENESESAHTSAVNPIQEREGRVTLESADEPVDEVNSRTSGRARA